MENRLFENGGRLTKTMPELFGGMEAALLFLGHHWPLPFEEQGVGALPPLGACGSVGQNQGMWTLKMPGFPGGVPFTQPNKDSCRKTHPACLKRPFLVGLNESQEEFKESSPEEYGMMVKEERNIYRATLVVWRIIHPTSSITHTSKQINSTIRGLLLKMEGDAPQLSEWGI